jgi:hypothetical protein
MHRSENPVFKLAAASLLRSLSCAGLLRARNGDIRSHVGAYLSVPKKWSKVCADGGVQSELRSCRRCSEGRGERTCFEGSGGLSDPALENQWQGYTPNMDLVETRSPNRILEGFNIRPTEWYEEPVR